MNIFETPTYAAAKTNHGGIEMNARKKVAIVTRSFQAGTGKNGKKFDSENFSEKVAKPIARLLKFNEIIGTIIIAVNTEKGNRLAEIINVDFPIGSEREKNHKIKVARQYSVMKEWANDVFPGLSFETVMDKMFANGHQD